MQIFNLTAGVANLLLSPHTQTHTNGHTHTVYRWCMKLTLTIITNAHKIGHTHTHTVVFMIWWCGGSKSTAQTQSTDTLIKLEWSLLHGGGDGAAQTEAKCVLVVSRSFVVFVSSIQHYTLYREFCSKLYSLLNIQN